jgi:anti-anti-sigma regulatory factor
MKAEFSTKKQKGGGMQLIVKGELTVQNSMALKESLTSMLIHQGEIKISLRDVQTLDVSSIQLLLAFRKTLDLFERSCIIIWPENKAIEELLYKSGITHAFQPN